MLIAGGSRPAGPGLAAGHGPPHREDSLWPNLARGPLAAAIRIWQPAHYSPPGSVRECHTEPHDGARNQSLAHGSPHPLAVDVGCRPGRSGDVQIGPVAHEAELSRDRL
jgi:hypothetical protein